MVKESPLVIWPPWFTLGHGVGHMTAESVDRDMDRHHRGIAQNIVRIRCCDESCNLSDDVVPAHSNRCKQPGHALQANCVNSF
jgi:hypothetical protein